MNAKVDTTTTSRLVWPLSGTQIAHAHLTWAEWTDQQAVHIASAQYLASARTVLDQSRSVMYIERDAASRLTWPLPATQFPNARLTWTEWLNAQSSGPAVRQSEHEALERAA
jgi:hypothetical protein